MTIELIDEVGEDAEEVTIAWISAVIRSAIRRRTGDPLPFGLVRCIDDQDDADSAFTTSTVSVHTLCDATLADAEALCTDKAIEVHRRIIYLSRNPLADIILSDARVANVNYLETVHKPIWVDYGDDQILRKVARYRIGHEFVPAPPAP